MKEGRREVMGRCHYCGLFVSGDLRDEADNNVANALIRLVLLVVGHSIDM